MLNETKLIKIQNFRDKKFLFFTLGTPLVISSLFIFYKYQTMKNELDRKYTPIYLKSKGKL